jgi:hypothetical protein
MLPGGASRKPRRGQSPVLAGRRRRVLGVGLVDVTEEVDLGAALQPAVGIAPRSCTRRRKTSPRKRTPGPVILASL